MTATEKTRFEEQRAHERVVVRYPVKVRIGEREIAGTVENLGVLGALVSTIELDPPLDVGHRISLTIAVSEKGPVETQGEILRVDQEFADGEIRRTFAVRFDHGIEP